VARKRALIIQRCSPESFRGCRQRTVGAVSANRCADDSARYNALAGIGAPEHPQTVVASPVASGQSAAASASDALMTAQATTRHHGFSRSANRGDISCHVERSETSLTISARWEPRNVQRSVRFAQDDNFLAPPISVRAGDSARYNARSHSQRVVNGKRSTPSRSIDRRHRLIPERCSRDR
jgi:hypothetical protein